MNQTVSKSCAPTTVTQLMQQYHEVMEGRDEEGLMKDPIIKLHMSVCNRMIAMHNLQVKLKQLAKKEAEKLNNEAKLQTLWLVTYMCTLKECGVNVMVQEPPYAHGKDPSKATKQRMSMLITNDTTAWSYENRDQFKLKQPMVRIVPYGKGLHMELRKITGMEGDTVRTMLKDHWQFDAKAMTAKINKHEIQRRLVESGFEHLSAA
jgi:hypothetical protein